LTLAELSLDPIDWVVSTDEDLDRMILDRARAKRPPRVPPSATVRLDQARDPKWPRDVTSWSEFRYLLATLRRMLSVLRPLSGPDLAPADRRDDSSINLKELKTRADSAVAALKKAAARKSPTVLVPFGIFGSPMGAAKEATTRLERIEKLDAAFKRDEASPGKAVEHDTERIRLVFGSTFPILPLITPGNAAELTKAFGASKSLQRGDPLAASAWLARVAQVRPRIAKFDDAARLVSAMSSIEDEHTVAQLPFAPDEAWIALTAAPGSVPAGKLALVASGTLPKFGAASCGVIVDEWAEMIPGARETTGLVFQFDRPASRPPQACLLAVAPDVGKGWDMETLEATLLETLDLARLRLVDQELLTEFDHYLPALQFALNVTSDVVSTDFR